MFSYFLAKAFSSSEASLPVFAISSCATFKAEISEI
nr:MAG TPA: hypothetical protein [Caudoviricetes sp.]